MAKSLTWTIADDVIALEIAKAFRDTRGLIDDQGQKSETLKQCAERVMDEVMTRAARKALKEAAVIAATQAIDDDLETRVFSQLSAGSDL
jgi:hypothetical protein